MQIPWQDTNYVLSLFASKVSTAKNMYMAFIREGIDDKKLRTYLSVDWFGVIEAGRN